MSIVKHFHESREPVDGGGAVIRLSTNQATPAHCMVTLPSMPTNEPPVSYSVFRRLASRCRFSRACPVADCRRWGGLPRDR